MAVALKEIDNAVDERRLGADDGEVGMELVGEGQQVVGFGGRRADAGGDLGATGIAGGDDDFSDGRAALEAPGDCMLATAAADNKDFHGSISWARRFFRISIRRCRRQRDKWFTTLW